MRLHNLLVAVSVLLASQAASAGNYAECILDKMPGSSNEAVTTAVIQTCTTEYPGGFYEIERGEAKSWIGLGFNTPQECTIKRAKDTPNQRAAGLIFAACRCLYGQPGSKGEACAYRPTQLVPAMPQEQPAIAPAPPPPVAASPVPAVRPYVPPKPERPTAAQLAKQAEIKADLDAVATRAIHDYPFLDTPAGAAVMEKIIERRDTLIGQGVYPSIALTRAVAAFAPAYAPLAPRLVPPAAALNPEPRVTATSGCRWVTPTKLTCP